MAKGLNQDEPVIGTVAGSYYAPVEQSSLFFVEFGMSFSYEIFLFNAHLKVNMTAELLLLLE